MSGLLILWWFYDGFLSKVVQNCQKRSKIVKIGPKSAKKSRPEIPDFPEISCPAARGLCTPLAINPRRIIYLLSSPRSPFSKNPKDRSTRGRDADSTSECQFYRHRNAKKGENGPKTVKKDRVEHPQAGSGLDFGAFSTSSLRVLLQKSRKNAL